MCKFLMSRPTAPPLAICRDLRVSRKVVRKVIRSQATEFHYQRDVQPQPKIGPWRERLDSLLLENDGKPARERLTLIRVFEELRALGFEGGYDAVRRYARAWSKERASATVSAYVGESQGESQGESRLFAKRISLPPRPAASL